MKILIIDDDPAIIEMVKVNLEFDGYKVVSANNGKDGVKLASQVRPDLILMDWMLPRMSGIDAVKLLKSNSAVKHIPIFMLTARSQLRDVNKAFESGADDYITKPFNPVKLASILQRKLKKIN